MLRTKSDKWKPKPQHMPDICQTPECRKAWAAMHADACVPMYWHVRGDSIAACYHCSRCSRIWTCYWSLGYMRHILAPKVKREWKEHAT
jgi:hypothetical protein